MADLDLTNLPGPELHRLTQVTASNLATVALKLFLDAAAIFFFIYFLWGGVQWILSGGDKEALENAKKRITHAIIGFIIVLCLFLIGGLINFVFKVDIFSICIPGVDSPIVSCPKSGIGQGAGWDYPFPTHVPPPTPAATFPPLPPSTPAPTNTPPPPTPTPDPILCNPPTNSGNDVGLGWCGGGPCVGGLCYCTPANTQAPNGTNPNCNQIGSYPAFCPVSFCP